MYIVHYIMGEQVWDQKLEGHAMTGRCTNARRAPRQLVVCTRAGGRAVADPIPNLMRKPALASCVRVAQLNNATRANIRAGRVFTVFAMDVVRMKSKLPSLDGPSLYLRLIFWRCVCTLLSEKRYMRCTCAKALL